MWMHNPKIPKQNGEDDKSKEEARTSSDNLASTDWFVP